MTREALGGVKNARKKSGLRARKGIFVFLAAILLGAAWFFVAGVMEAPVVDARLVLRTTGGEPVFKPESVPAENLSRLVPWVTVINSGHHGFWVRDAGIVSVHGGAVKRTPFRIVSGRPFRIGGGEFSKFQIEDVRGALEDEGKTYVRDLFGREFRSNGSDVAEILRAYAAAESKSP